MCLTLFLSSLLVEKVGNLLRGQNKVPVDDSSSKNDETALPQQEAKVDAQNDFLAEDSIMTDENPNSTLTRSNTHQFQDEKENPDVSTETIIVESEEMIVWSFDEHDLLKCLDHDIKLSLLSYNYLITQENLRQAWEEKINDDTEKARLQQIAMDYLFDGVISKNSGNL